MSRIAGIYYTATGNVHMLASAIAEGAPEAGADVRLKRVAELTPEEAIRQNQVWGTGVACSSRRGSPIPSSAGRRQFVRHGVPTA